MSLSNAFGKCQKDKDTIVHSKIKKASITTRSRSSPVLIRQSNISSVDIGFLNRNNVLRKSIGEISAKLPCSSNELSDDTDLKDLLHDLVSMPNSPHDNSFENL